MKKSLLIIVAFVMTMCLTVKADNDRVITFEQLPAEAQTMLKKYFADKVPLVSAVPTALIPEQIKASVKKTFPGATIIKLDRDRRGYDVKLNNGMELEFNKKFEIVDIDD